MRAESPQRTGTETTLTSPSQPPAQPPENQPATDRPPGNQPDDQTRRQPAHRFREELIIGPPGCGKTTELSRQVRISTQAGNTVLVCSLTRASAAEIAGRDLPISADAVGTLHAHCFHALGQPIIAEDRIHLEDWNNQHPAMAMTVSATDKSKSFDEDNLDPGLDQAPGDALMQEYQILRSRMQRPQPDSPVGQFAAAWTHWKNQSGLMDFTDLIEVCLRDINAAPGAPDVIYVDEAQDLDQLEMALIRKWADSAGHMVAVGDPDQAIYIWRGADPRAFSTPHTDSSTTHVLEQSYRIPKQVHSHAVSWINRIADRKHISYNPREVDGEFKRIEATYRFPEIALHDAEHHLADGKTIMFLASCSYMLTNLIDALKRTGTPFWNPNRRSNGAWNPLQRRARAITAADRLLAFLSFSETSYWTAEDIHRWTNAAKVSGVLQKGGRQAVKNLQNDEDGAVSWDRMHELFTEEAIEAGLSGDLDWYQDQLVTSKRQGSVFPLTIARLRGPGFLSEQPQVVVGTIHSTKGAEADVVYVFPDISKAGMAEWTGAPHQQASVFRLFYVGMTRAKEKLVICNPATRAHVNI